MLSERILVRGHYVKSCGTDGGSNNTSKPAMWAFHWLEGHNILILLNITITIHLMSSQLITITISHKPMWRLNVFFFIWLTVL